MKIVIDIDEGIAQGIIDGKNDVPSRIVRSFQATIADAIKNGTPLPEHHGRIIDESKITKLYTYVPNAFCKGGGWRTEDFNATNTDAPTIIKADKE